MSAPHRNTNRTFIHAVLMWSFTSTGTILICGSFYATNVPWRVIGGIECIGLAAAVFTSAVTRK